MTTTAGPRRLAGRVALVTGAARGMGRAHAIRLAEEGADVIALDVGAPVDGTSYPSSTPEELLETADAVEQRGRAVVARQADVRDLDAVEKAVAAGFERFGRLDAVVANAGIVGYGRLWELEPEQWDAMIGVNLTGVWHTIKAAVPRMIEAGNGGSITITGSTSGLRGFPLIGHYVASKHAVVGLARSLALELAEYDIRVNTVHPGSVQTGIGQSGAAMTPLMEKHPHFGTIYGYVLGGEPMEPEDVAAVVAFLASDEGRHITGAAVPVDRGAAAR